MFTYNVTFAVLQIYGTKSSHISRDSQVKILEVLHKKREKYVYHENMNPKKVRVALYIGIRISRTQSKENY